MLIFKCLSVLSVLILYIMHFILLYLPLPIFDYFSPLSVDQMKHLQ